MIYKIKWLDIGEVEIPCNRAFYLGSETKTVHANAYSFLLEGEDGTFSLIDTGIRDPDEIDVGPTSSTKWIVSKKQKLVTRLEQYGLKPDDISNVLLTHLHYDHCSQIGIFRKAKIFISNRELMSVIAPSNKKILSYTKYPRDVFAYIVDQNWHNVRTFDDLEEVLPGIHAFVVGGHTLGSTAYLVQTSKGNTVIAGDFISWYDNLEKEIPPGLAVSIEDWFVGLRRITNLNAIIVPSHDPKIMTRFPSGVIP